MKKIALILFTSILIVSSGCAVAYYNTSSFGYDNANILSVDDKYIRVFDVYINYNKIREKFEKISSKMPDEYITI